MANQCRKCRFFSELVAQAGNNGLEALCMASGSIWSGSYVSETFLCDDFAEATDGAIDEPGKDPLRYEAEARA